MDKRVIKRLLRENLTDEPSELNDNFWRWFDGSKVTGNGAPLVCYDGTDRKFDVFRYGEFGFHFGTENQARLMGSNIMPVYLRLKNPLYTIDFPRWEGYIMSKLLNKYGVLSDKE